MDPQGSFVHEGLDGGVSCRRKRILELEGPASIGAEVSADTVAQEFLQSSVTDSLDPSGVWTM